MTSPDRRERLILLVVTGVALVAGLALRLQGALTEPLWLDEAYTAYAADRGLAFLWTVVPGYETHPPLFYTLMHLWGLVAGEALAMRRVPSLVAGIALVACAAIAGARLAPNRRIAGRMAAAAVLLVALSPMAIEMARQMRPYAFMVLAYAAGLLAILSVGRAIRAGDAIPLRAFAAVLACEILLAWLHNLGPLHALSLGLALLVQLDWRSGRSWLIWLGGHALVLLAWAPALLILADQAPTWVSSTWLEFHWRDLFPKTLGLLYATPDMLPVAWLLAAIGAALLIAIDGRGRDAATLLILAFLPVILSIAITVIVAPVFLTRTLSPVVVPLLLLVARASQPSGRLRWVAMALVAIVAAQFTVQDLVARRKGPLQHWHTAVEWLGTRFRPGDVVWAYPNEGALPFDYAARDRRLPFRARPIPMAVPAQGIGFYPTGSRGAVSLRPAEIARFAADPQARTARTLWLLRLGPNAYDPDDAMLHALEHDGRRRVSAFIAGPIQILGLRRADLPPPDYLARRRRQP